MTYDFDPDTWLEREKTLHFRSHLLLLTASYVELLPSVLRRSRVMEAG